MTQPATQRGSARRNAMIALIVVASFAAALNQTTLATAVPTLMKDFSISMSTAQQATTWFLLGNGIMIPVTAYLMLKFKTKTLYLFAYGCIFVGTLLIVLAPTSQYGVFLTGRIVQSIGVGVTAPLLQVVLVELFPAQNRGAAMGLAGIPIALAPALGPTFAGWVLNADHHFLGVTLTASWRSIFLVPLIVIAACLVLAPFIMQNILKNEKVKLDIISLLLSVLGFGLFLWGFTNVANDGWTRFDTVIAPIVGGMVIIALFVIRQLHMKEPFLDMRVFTVRQFTVSTVTLSIVTMAMMGVEMMLPIYLQQVRQLSALNSGLVLLPGSMLMVVVMLIAGRIYDKIGAKRLTITGFVLLTIGTFPFMLLNETVSEHFVTTLYGLRMVAIAMIMMSLFTNAVSTVPQADITHATASSNTARQVASSVVVALFSSVTQYVTNLNAPNASMKTTNPIQFADETIGAALKGFHMSFIMAFVFSILGIVFACFLRSGRVVAVKEID